MQDDPCRVAGPPLYLAQPASAILPRASGPQTLVQPEATSAYERSMISTR